MIVYGFPNKIAALKFEYAWQHAHKTRYIPSGCQLIKGKSWGPSGRNLHYKLAVVKQLLNNEYFMQINLRVRFFSSDARDVWENNKFSVPLNDCYDEDGRVGPSLDCLPRRNKDVKKLTVDEILDLSARNLELVKDFRLKCKEDDEAIMKRLVDELTVGRLVCGICKDSFDYTSEDKDDKPFITICIKEDCKFATHLRCLYKLTMQVEVETVEREKRREEPSFQTLRPFIPKVGTCPGCGTRVEWGVIIKYSSMIKKLYG